MSKAKRIGNIGQWIMVAGALLYMIQLIVEASVLTYKQGAAKTGLVTLFEKIYVDSRVMTWVVLALFIVALVMMAIGKFSKKEK